MAFAKLLLVSLSIFALVLFIRKKSDRAIDFYQPENLVNHASESEEKVYELQQPLKRSLELENLHKFEDKKVANHKLEKIDRKWFLSKLGLNLSKTQTYLMTLWKQHLSLALEKKWIPSIKDASVTTYLEPKLHYLTDKSIEVLLYTAKRVLTPDLIQEFDVSYYYLQINRIMTIAKLHLKKKVQVSFESCTENVRHGFNKLVNLGRKKIRKVTQRAFNSG